MKVSFPLLHLLITMVLACTTLPSAARAQDEERPCSDTIVPVWWTNYREQGLERGKLTGGGSAKHNDLSQADAGALEAAERDLNNWLKRRFEEIALWFAQTYARDSDLVTTQSIEAVVEELVAYHANKCQRYRTESILRCDGRTEGYVLVELDLREIPGQVSRKLVERFMKDRPDSAQVLVSDVEDKVRIELGSQDLLTLPDPTDVTVSSADTVSAPVLRPAKSRATAFTLSIIPGAGWWYLGRGDNAKRDIAFVAASVGVGVLAWRLHESAIDDYEDAVRKYRAAIPPGEIESKWSEVESRYDRAKTYGRVKTGVAIVGGLFVLRGMLGVLLYSPEEEQAAASGEQEMYQGHVLGTQTDFQVDMWEGDGIRFSVRHRF